MAKLSHKRATVPTVAEVLEGGARRLARAGLFYGHGTDNARDEAAALVWFALGLPWDGGAAVLRRRVPAQARRVVDALLERRIRERIPAVYLTGMTFFAGIPMRVDARALIPRSPLAELIEAQFRPWVEPRRVERVLDLCTGSGCIALACAVWMPWTRVDASDVSEPALELARENRRALGLARRVRLVRSDHFAGLAGRTYDMIVSNPPYVGSAEMRRLPAEYRHEPRLALAAGRDGLDSVRVILRDAARHLRPGGLLIVEVGNSEAAVRRAFPRLPFTWLEFERGGGGVFLLTREQLAARVPGRAKRRAVARLP